VTKDKKVYIMDFNVSFKNNNKGEPFKMMTKTGTVTFSAPEVFI
jgi:hypothetical protein